MFSKTTPPEYGGIRLEVCLDLIFQPSRLLKYRFWADSLEMLTSQNTLQAIFSAWLRGQVPGNWLNLGVQKRYFSSLLGRAVIAQRLVLHTITHIAVT
jgi:hypothetical protein